MIPEVAAARARQWAKRCRRNRETCARIQRSHPNEDWILIHSRTRALGPPLSPGGLPERRIPPGTYVDPPVIYPDPE